MDHLWRAERADLTFQLPQSRVAVGESWHPDPDDSPAGLIGAGWSGPEGEWPGSAVRRDRLGWFKRCWSRTKMSSYPDRNGASHHGPSWTATADHVRQLLGRYHALPPDAPADDLLHEIGLGIERVAGVDLDTAYELECELMDPHAIPTEIITGGSRDNWRSNPQRL